MSHLFRARPVLRIGMLVAVAIVGIAHAQTGAPTNALPNPYRAVENWAKMPEGRTWGSTSGVGVDPDGTSIWVAERCGVFAAPALMKPGSPFACDGSTLAPILKFDSAGTLWRGNVAVSAWPSCRSRR